MLDDISDRLHAHFTDLSVQKEARGNADPIFALEHPLSAEEVQTLAVLLGESLGLYQCMLPRNSLAWVVHAAEQGYAFDGFEYWDSFATRTANWQRFGNRERLRHWFRMFSEAFHGAQPAGEWAKHYSYISWPVTHALVPRDMQVQLAHTLYQMRRELGSASALSPEDVGRMMQRYAYEPSPRFIGFLQRHALVGRIVKALLQTDANDETSIFSPALERITSDINSRSEAREWLKDAQSHYTSHSFHLPGSSPRSVSSSTSTNVEAGDESAVDEPQEPVLAPARIHLEQHGDVWKAFLRLPSFLLIAQRDPAVRKYLEAARYSVLAHNDSASPARGLLVGQHRARSLARWPDPDEQLLTFMPPPPVFDGGYDLDLLFARAKVWLFKKRKDFTAGQLLNRSVRSGSKYIVCTRDPKVLEGLGTGVQLSCAGIYAKELKVPAYMSLAFSERLRQIGLSLHRTVTVKPVGLWPRDWDGEDLGEWLTTETPQIILLRDHPFDSAVSRPKCNSRVSESKLRVDESRPGYERRLPEGSGRHG